MLINWRYSRKQTHLVVGYHIAWLRKPENGPTGGGYVRWVPPIGSYMVSVDDIEGR